jgi:hypothetical protein
MTTTDRKPEDTQRELEYLRDVVARQDQVISELVTRHDQLLAALKDLVAAGHSADDRAYLECLDRAEAVLDSRIANGSKPSEDLR